MLSIGTISVLARYGNTVTVTVTDTDAFQKTPMYGTKDSNSTEWHLQVDGKTMWSSPTARLVNSNNEVRSETVTISDETGTFTGNLYAKATIGYWYYLSVKPSAFQAGSDTITGMVNPD